MRVCEQFSKVFSFLPSRSGSHLDGPLCTSFCALDISQVVETINHLNHFSIKVYGCHCIPGTCNAPGANKVIRDTQTAEPTASTMAPLPTLCAENGVFSYPPASHSTRIPTHWYWVGVACTTYHQLRLRYIHFQSPQLHRFFPTSEHLLNLFSTLCS